MTEGLLRLRRDQLPEAVGLLVDAFEDDPMFRFLVPGQRARRAWLSTFMRAGVQMVWPCGHVYGIGDGRLDGVLLLLPPGQAPPRFWRSLVFSLRLLGRALIGQPSPRVVWRTRRLARLLNESHPTEPHWMLYQIAVAPAAQGQGLGRRMLEGVVRLAADPPAPVYLDTTRESNMGLYQRFGFVKTRTLELPGVPPAWTMVRPATP